MYKTEADFFFSDSEGNIPHEVNPRDVDDVQEAYLRTLIKTYEKLKQKFENIKDNCMNEEQLKRAGKVDSLVLPWHERPEANLNLNFDVSPFKPKIHDSIDKTQPAN